jgi:rRNA-processing protein FCF1
VTAYVAVLDANVLVPILSCDLLLTAFDHDLYQPVVTSKILDEIERNLVAAHPELDSDRLRDRVGHMRRALRLHTGPDSGRRVEGVNAKDEHIVAVALDAAADVVVTNDRQLRREILAVAEDLGVQSADEFAASLAKQAPEAVDAVIDELVAKRVRRPVTRDELLHRLSSALPSFVETVERGR